jgi:hypothetical protein
VIITNRAGWQPEPRMSESDELENAHRALGARLAAFGAASAAMVPRDGR